MKKLLQSRWALPGILAFGLALRLIGLDSRPLFYDEAFSYFLSIQPLGKIVQGTAADTMPPLYYFLLHGWALLGNSVWFLRSLNVLVSLGVIYLVYLLAKMLFGAEAGVWAATFTAVAPFQIYYAQEMRMYTLLALGLLGYLYFFLCICLEKGRPAWNWVGLVAFGSMALYSHNLAIFTLFVPSLYLILRKKWRLLGQLAIAQAGMGLIFLPWLVMVPGQVEKIQTAFWTAKPGLVDIIQLAIIFVTNLPLPGWGIMVAGVVSFEILIIVALESWRNHWFTDNSLLPWLVAAAPVIVLFAVSYLMRPVFVPRGLIVSSLAGYILLARVAACGSNRIVGTIAGGLFVIAALTALPAQVNFREFPRSPYRDAEAWIATRDKTGLVLHENKLSYFPMKFYAPWLDQAFLPDQPGTANDTLAPQSAEAMGLIPAVDTAAAVGDNSFVEYVVFQRELLEVKQAGGVDPPGLRWLKANFHQVATVSFSDLTILTFSR